MYNYNQIIKNQIQQMVHSSQPYFPNPSEIYSVHSGIDHWPYQKSFRGTPSPSIPQVWERSAGYDPILSKPLPVHVPQNQLSDICFQPACNTVFPCKAKQTFLPLEDSCIIYSP